MAFVKLYTTYKETRESRLPVLFVQKGNGPQIVIKMISCHKTPRWKLLSTLTFSRMHPIVRPWQWYFGGNIACSLWAAMLIWSSHVGPRFMLVFLFLNISGRHINLFESLCANGCKSSSFCPMGKRIHVWSHIFKLTFDAKGLHYFSSCVFRIHRCTTNSWFNQSHDFYGIGSN